MKHRMLALVGVAAVIAVVSLVFIARQTPTTTAQTGSALKTAWGEPDLQGIWDTAPVQIPLQRPAKYKDQEFFTDAQIAELDKIRAAMPGNETRSVRGTELDVAGAYNAVFTSRRPTGRRTSLIVDPPDGRIPPVTGEVMKRRREIRELQLALLENTDTCKNKWPGCEGGKYTGVPSPRRNEPFKHYTGSTGNRPDGPENFGLGNRCMAGALPDFGGFRQIIQSPGAVSIFYDTGQGQGWHRIIPITSAAHLSANVRTWWGDSRGRWEDNTLVVDVTNFTPKRDFNGSLDNLHLVERWTRTGPNTIEYVVTMDDPTSWTKPWTVKQEYAKQSDQLNRIYKEPRCHEGNFAMIGELAGARSQERAFAEGRGPDPTTINYTTPTAAANALGVASGQEDADPLQ